MTSRIDERRQDAENFVRLVVEKRWRMKLDDEKFKAVVDNVLRAFEWLDKT